MRVTTPPWRRLPPASPHSRLWLATATSAIKTSDADVRADAGMNTAFAAAENALSNGPDKSNGAWFWDGADIKFNDKKHFKVQQGIRFKVNRKVQHHKEELYRYDHVYESTAVYGDTIFWQHAPDYLKFTRAKEYK